MPVLLGGEKAWKQRVSGDIVVSYQWVNGEPAMILFPKVKRLGLSGAYALANFPVLPPENWNGNLKNCYYSIKGCSDATTFLHHPRQGG